MTNSNYAELNQLYEKYRNQGPISMNTFIQSASSVILDESALCEGFSIVSICYEYSVVVVDIGSEGSHIVMKNIESYMKDDYFLFCFRLGLEILAFPCNQFGDEEPGSNDQILDFVCTRFKSEFPIFNKIEVNGENASPLYKFLKSGKWGIFGDDIQWNFAKFLVNKEGQVVDRYYPTTSPLSLEFDINKLLGID